MKGCSPDISKSRKLSTCMAGGAKGQRMLPESCERCAIETESITAALLLEPPQLLLHVKPAVQVMVQDSGNQLSGFC